MSTSVANHTKSAAKDAKQILIDALSPDTPKGAQAEEQRFGGLRSSATVGKKQPQSQPEKPQQSEKTISHAAAPTVSSAKEESKIAHASATARAHDVKKASEAKVSETVPYDSLRPDFAAADLPLARGTRSRSASRSRANSATRSRANSSRGGQFLVGEVHTYTIKADEKERSASQLPIAPRSRANSGAAIAHHPAPTHDVPTSASASVSAAPSLPKKEEREASQSRGEQNRSVAFADAESMNAANRSRGAAPSDIKGNSMAASASIPAAPANSVTSSHTTAAPRVDRHEEIIEAAGASDSLIVPAANSAPRERSIPAPAPAPAASANNNAKTDELISSKSEAPIHPKGDKDKSAGGAGEKKAGNGAFCCGGSSEETEAEKKEALAQKNKAKAEKEKKKAEEKVAKEKKKAEEKAEKERKKAEEKAEKEKQKMRELAEKEAKKKAEKEAANRH